MFLGDALRVMDKVDGRGAPVPFSITFVTYDKRRGTGGKVRRLSRAVRCGANHNLQRNRQVAVRPVHGKAHVYPIHLRLILRINEEPVL
jgi:hypothetical protein